MSYINLTKSGNKNINITCDNLTALDTVTSNILTITQAIETPTIAAITVNCADLNAVVINSVDISCNDFTAANNIDAVDISCNNISCNDFTAANNINAVDISCNNLEAENNIVSNNTISCTDFSSVTCDSDLLSGINCNIINDLSANQVFAVRSFNAGALGLILVEHGIHQWAGSDDFTDNPLVISNLDGDEHLLYKLIVYGNPTFTNNDMSITINYNGVVTGTDYQGITSTDSSYTQYDNEINALLIRPQINVTFDLFCTSYINADRTHDMGFVSRSNYYSTVTSGGSVGTSDNKYANTANNNMTSLQIDVSNTNHGLFRLSYRLMRYY